MNARKFKVSTVNTNSIENTDFSKNYYTAPYEKQHSGFNATERISEIIIEKGVYLANVNGKTYKVASL